MELNPHAHDIVRRFLREHPEFPDASAATERLLCFSAGFYVMGVASLILQMHFEHRAGFKLHVFPDDCPLETALYYICTEVDGTGGVGQFFILGRAVFVWSGDHIEVYDGELTIQ